ncbi:substrate-binding domain-containing protein [candidate division KSB1 bacterium]|nr:substrate-binding domain-containing protein [candidate division KSB1 bacterium]
MNPGRTPFRAALVFVILILVLVVFFGCRSNTGEGSDSRYKIAGMVFQEDQFFRLVRYGMIQAAAAYDAELLQANSLGKPDKEIQLVNTYIARGVDAIVISPLSATASVTALKRAHDRGIVVVTYNSTIEGDIPTSFVESDQRDLGAKTGQAAVRYIQKKLSGKAKIAILAFKSNLPEQSDARTGGFKEQVQQLPGVQIVAEQDAWMAETAVKKAGDILTAHPDLDILFAANEGGTVGSVMAVKNSGRAGKVAVFGTDVSEQLIDFLLFEDNILQAITGQQPFEIGFKAVEYAVKSLNQEPVETKLALPGVLLSREDQEGVRAFKKSLLELIAGSAS